MCCDDAQAHTDDVKICVVRTSVKGENNGTKQWRHKNGVFILLRTTTKKEVYARYSQTCIKGVAELVLGGHPRSIKRAITKSREEFPLITVKLSCIKLSPRLHFLFFFFTSIQTVTSSVKCTRHMAFNGFVVLWILHLVTTFFSWMNPCQGLSQFNQSGWTNRVGQTCIKRSVDHTPTQRWSLNTRLTDCTTLPT